MHKAVHIITAPVPAEQLRIDLAALLERHPVRVNVYAPPGGGAEALLARASKAEVVQLALEFSRARPELRVDAHFRINAFWSSAGGLADDDTASVIHVGAPPRRVLGALEALGSAPDDPEVHVQAARGGTHVVLPDTAPPEHLERLRAALEALVAAATVRSDVRGRWVANGSRHHEFLRFRGGALLPFQTDRLWPE